MWQFVSERLTQRPLTGFGFAAFWGTPEVVYGMGQNEVWANTAGHAHDGYLDLALTVGIPGAVLGFLWLVVLPLMGFLPLAARGGPRSAGNAVSAGLFVRGLRVVLREPVVAGRHGRAFSVHGNLRITPALGNPRESLKGPTRHCSGAW